jgi:hypothetical protein
MDSSFAGVWKHWSLVKRAADSVTTVPFKNNTFNVVCANIVVEHLPDPSVALAEVAPDTGAGRSLLFFIPPTCTIRNR